MAEPILNTITLAPLEFGSDSFEMLFDGRISLLWKGLEMFGGIPVYHGTAQHYEFSDMEFERIKRNKSAFGLSEGDEIFLIKGYPYTLASQS